MWVEKRSARKACGYKHPPAPQVKTLFEEGEATPAVLTFLRETKVGQMVGVFSFTSNPLRAARGAVGAAAVPLQTYPNPVSERLRPSQ